jgi:hypothetical protein
MILRHILNKQNFRHQAKWLLLAGQFSFLLGIVLSRWFESMIADLVSGILLGASIVLNLTYLSIWRNDHQGGAR